MKINADRPRDLAAARHRYYDRLAEHFVREIGSGRIRTILEAGCGRGQLTIPLLGKLPTSARMIAVDSSKGPYAGWLNELAATLHGRRLGHRVRVVDSDVRHLEAVDTESVDVVVSNELICDLPRKPQLQKALGEFYRVLRPGGIMVHGEWSSCPTAGPQGLLIRHWPSWTPDQLFVLMRDAGFLSFRDSRRGSRSREPRSLYQCAYLGIISPSDPGVEQDMESRAHVPSLTGSLGKEGLDERR